LKISTEGPLIIAQKSENMAISIKKKEISSIHPWKDYFKKIQHFLTFFSKGGLIKMFTFEFYCCSFNQFAHHYLQSPDSLLISAVDCTPRQGISF
jgi:hypothetical protein